MISLIKSVSNITPLKIKKLNGYENENFHVKGKNGDFVFKTYRYSEALYSQLLGETETLLFLKKQGNEKIPNPISFNDGSYIKVLFHEERQIICRILTFLKGSFWGDVESNDDLYKSLGAFLGDLNLQLQGFFNPNVIAIKHDWDIQNLSLSKKYINNIPSVKDQNVVRYFFMLFEREVVPEFNNIRKSIVHNDANEWNVLIKNGSVSGIIDFGDLAYTPLINEISTAITYACYDKENTLEPAIFLLKEYNKKIPLSEKEVDLIYYLMAAKLCISVCKSANAKKNTPENTYASISENNAWKMLYYLLSTSPVLAKNKFRNAIGFKQIAYNPKDAIAKRNRYISPVLSLSYKDPIYMDRGAFQYMFDKNGSCFLDAYNNIPHVGHSHPVVVEAGQKQMEKLNTNTRYLYDQLSEYSEKLLEKFPAALNKVFFVNSGSAASDLAIRMAKKHTGLKDLMVMEHGYHGNTQTGIDISDYKFNNPKGDGQKSFIFKTEMPKTYNGRFDLNDKLAGEKYAEDAIYNLNKKQVAAFISEPIVGCGGQIPLAPGYLKKLYPFIRKNGGICISDEVQTGFGRLGDFFWGFEAHDVVPDIVILGKPMGNGHPLGAVVTTNEISNSFESGVEFFSSFGGNPVSCAIGLSVLKVIEEEKLQENAKKVGDYYKGLLLDLKNKFNCIGDVRGSGLFLGIELIDEKNKANTLLAQHIKNELRENHILISTDGPHDSVLKSKPPLCFTKQNAKTVVKHIEYSINNFYNNK